MQSDNYSQARRASHAHGLRLATLMDFLGAAALILFTAFQTVVFLGTVEVTIFTTLLILASTILNLIGLFVAIAYQRSVFTITFFFTLFFLSLAPMQQLMNQFDSIMAEPSILARAFGFCLIFSAICLAALLVIGPAPMTKSAAPRLPSFRFPTRAAAILFVILCGAIGIGLISFSHGILTDRTTYSEILQAQASQPMFLLYTGALRPFTVYGSVVGLWLAWSHRRIDWLAAFGVTLMGGLFLANPLVTPRFEVAAMIYAIIFYFAGRGHNRFLLLALLLGVVTAPLFNLFRLNDVELEQTSLTSFLSSGDFDAFSLLAHTIWHVDLYGFDYGKNIVSAIFFFVPRAIWPTKNEITPFYLMQSLQTYRGLWNYNLSEPLIAEGYFAFGAIGVVATSFIFACFAWFLEVSAGENRLNPIYLFCCAAPPLLFILLRGSLIVGFAVVVGHFLAISLAVRLATLRFSTAKARRNVRLRPIRLPQRLSPPG